MTPTKLTAKAAPSRTISGVILGVGNSLTGAGTVMLGVLLPIFSLKWGLRDDAAGFLLFLQFSGSALGAIFTSADRVRSLMRGYGMLAASSCALAFATRHTAFAIFFFFGLGLGMTMTATSLLFSDRWSDDRAAKLEALNFAWSAGAAIAPMLFLPFFMGADLELLFFPFGILSLAFLAWVTFGERRSQPQVEVQELLPMTRSTPTQLVQLLVLAMCSVGIEASLNGWLTTYSHRAAPQGVTHAAMTTSLFWVGVVLSRLAFSTRLLAKMGRFGALQWNMWGLAVSMAMLTLTDNPTIMLFASGLSGIFTGPLYPLILSYLLERSTRGWIFAVAGTGSALLPWLTGLLSARFGSLHFGLLAPCGAVLLMIVLGSEGYRRSGQVLLRVTKI